MNPPTPPTARPGRFLSVDAAGYLVNDTDRAHLPAGWEPALRGANALYRERLGEDLHSVWVRGSAVSGQVVPGISDLDTLALVDRAPGADGLWVDLGDLETAEAALNPPGCTGVELCAASIEALPTERGGFLRFLLATQSTRVDGADLHLPRYRVDRSICFLAPHVAPALATARQDRPTEKDLPGLTRWLAKTLVRGGLELVLERDGRYARDLWPCAVAFSAHEPDQAAAMERALQAAVNPDPAELDFLLDDFGPWLADRLSAANLA